MDESLSEAHRTRVKRILSAGEHLLALIDQVLDLERIAEGNVTISIEPVEVASLVEEVVTTMGPLAAQHGVELDIRLGRPSATIAADRARLRQVLMNLVSNAVKYNRPEGSPTVLWSDPARGTIRVSVLDTGTGIPEEEHANLFKTFTRLGPATEGESVIGLGLAVSRRLVEAMGGTMDFESTPGEGSRFYVDLPAGDSPSAAREEITEKPSEEITEEPSKDADATRSDPYQVLYIEDNPANLRLVEEILSSRADITLLTAPQAPMGLELAEVHGPHLILLDLHLPGMDGFEALKRLRVSERTRHVRVLAISADAMPGDVRRGFEAGFDGYETKPINVVQFLETISRLLPSSSSAPPNA